MEPDEPVTALDVRLPRTRDDVTGSLGIESSGLGFFGLCRPAGTRIDTTPGLEGQVPSSRRPGIRLAG